ncbi:hypothetical protein K492DRAFT_192324 [Lichtheimia hyalospora FSU 10163]|nr:hypothetical protein K492DRAFT_192324 [Lichtheimia hyalospora FSU 10163]
MSDSSGTPSPARSPPVQVLPGELLEFQQLYGEILNDQELLELYEQTRENHERAASQEEPTHNAPQPHVLPSDLLLSPEQVEFYSNYRGHLTAQDIRNLQAETAMIREMMTLQEAYAQDSPPQASSPPQGMPSPQVLPAPQEIPLEGFSPAQEMPPQAIPPEKSFAQQEIPSEGSSPTQGASSQAVPPEEFSTPQGSTPQGTPPQAIPSEGSSVPRELALEESSPSQELPPQVNPSEESFATQAIPSEGSSPAQEMPPEETSASQEIQSEGSSPSQGLSLQAIPSEEPSAPQEMLSEGASSQETPSEGSSSVQAIPQEGSSTPQQTPTEAIPPEETSTLQEMLSEGSSPPQGTPQGSSPGSLHENLEAITIREALHLPAEAVMETIRMAIQRELTRDDESTESEPSSEEAVERAHRPLWSLVGRLFAYIVFMLPSVAKEIVYSFAAHIDMLCFCPIVNLCLYLLKDLGFYQDRNYINPWRMFLPYGAETSRTKIFLRITLVWIGTALLLAGYMDLAKDQPMKPGLPAEVDLVTKYGATTSTFQHMQTSTLPSIFESEEWTSALETTYDDESKDGDWKAIITSKLNSWFPISNFSSKGIICSVCNRFCAQFKAMLPDHALTFGGGSRVLMELTSPTFGLDDEKEIPPIFMKPITVSGKPHPVAALTDYRHAGTCWLMAGKQGSLGVRMRQPVSVKAISIDYMDYAQFISRSSAPADFEVWGLTHKDRGFWEYLWHSLVSPEENNGKVYLGKFQYDINKGTPVQTFKIQHSSPPIKDIVFRFLNNWGHDEYTCIYRVRVHGVVV